MQRIVGHGLSSRLCGRQRNSQNTQKTVCFEGLTGFVRVYGDFVPFYSGFELLVA